MQVDLALRGRLHREARWHDRPDRIGHAFQVGVTAHDHVHAVHEPGPREGGLGRGDVHDHQGAALDARHSLGGQETAYREPAAPRGRVELDAVAHPDLPPRGEFAREQHRVRLAQEHEGVLQLVARSAGGLVDADRRVVRDVDAVHGELLAAAVGGERRGAHHGHRELHPGDGADRGGDLLGKEPPLGGGDLESAPTRHRVDDLRECLEDGAAHQLDRAHEADAARQGEHREAPSAHAPPEKSPGHPEAEYRHVAPPDARGEGRTPFVDQRASCCQRACATRWTSRAGAGSAPGGTRLPDLAGRRCCR